MDSINKDNASWFKNIKKNDDGDNVDIIPSDKVLLRASSSHTNHNVRNLTDTESSTKWTSNYSIQTYKDELYTNRQITVGDYSRGEIVKDGKNRKLLNDNQQYKDSLRNKINSLRNSMNNDIKSYKSQLKDRWKLDPRDYIIIRYINFGRSSSNTVGIWLGWDYRSYLRPVYSIISNSEGRFSVEIKSRSLWVKRIDSRRTGWRGLSVPVYQKSRSLYERAIAMVEPHNKKIRKLINGVYISYYWKIKEVQNKLDDTPDVNIHDLPLTVTDDGKYTGNKQTVLTNNSVIKGEWIDVKVPNTIVIKEYELLPGRRDNNPEQLTPFPKDFYLLGSNDTDKWEIIDSHFDYTPSYSDNNTPITFDINNKKQYSNIRLVIAGLNPAYTDFKGLGAVSLSMFNLSGNICYSLNKTSCETFQSYINNKNMSTIEGLTMMDENINVLADLKDFNKKYSKYIKCNDITLSDNIKQDCTSEDNIYSVNNAYSKLMDNDNGSIKILQNTLLNKYSTVAEYESMKKEVLKQYNEIVPLRQELDHKLKILTDDKNSFLADYSTNYDNTMYTSLGLSVVLTSTLYFIFKQL